MRVVLVFIFLTVLSPILALAEKVDFIYEGSVLFRFQSDGSPDEVHILEEDKKNWRLLAKGNFSELTLPSHKNIPKLPERVRLGSQKTYNLNVVIDGQWAVLVTEPGLKPGQGRYLLPDADL